MIHHLRAAGVSVVVDARGTGVPAILHWGSDLGDLDGDALDSLARAMVPAIPPSSVDVPLRVTLLPSLADGWIGRPGLQMFRLDPRDPRVSGAHRNPRWTLSRSETAERNRSHILEWTVEDAELGAAVGIELELTETGVLRIRHRVENAGETALGIGRSAVVLPVPPRASEALDFSGLWSHERRPIRRPLEHGVHAREGRHGRGGHDAAFLLAVGTPGFGFRHGEVWAAHVAWSGDTEIWAEQSSLGVSTIGAGELLDPGELSLDPGDSYTTPWTVAVYSGTGLDGISDRLHPWIRSWASGRLERPLVLNTWEAVYFDQSLERLRPLVSAAARVGAERFVLDDGWFHGRRDDRRALGDWSVDSRNWPDGLGPLIDLVRDSGMSFGLWVEPEMINPDSDLARSHPEWVLGRSDDLTWRNQHVLDLTAPGAADHIFAALDDLLSTYEISYLKWDHNRDLLTGSAHAQTLATYELMDRLRAAHPGIEIESCASGGARIDLGILERTDRVWPSDTNDPLERQGIHRYTSLLVPPEYLGAHLGAERAHTTGRQAELSFRLITALFGHAGIEWNLVEASDAELALISAWASEYRRLRPLLRSGSVVRADADDPAQIVHGVVAHDRRHAVFSVAVQGSTRGALPPRVRFPGLDPDLRYGVRRLDLGGAPRAIEDASPPWFDGGEIEASGLALQEVGLAMPLLAPENAIAFELRAR